MWVILAAAVLLMPPDEPAAKLSGARVRVTTRAVGTTGGHTANAKPLIGTLAGFDEHMLTLALVSGEKVAVPADQVLRFETLVRPSRKTKGAAIGASILGGAALAYLVSLCTSDWGCEGADPAPVVAFVLVPATLGAVVGGNVADGDRWKSVPLARARTSGAGRTGLHLGHTPDKRGLAASVSLRPF